MLRESMGPGPYLRVSTLAPATSGWGRSIPWKPYPSHDWSLNVHSSIAFPQTVAAYRDMSNKKVSYRKQIAHQHSCRKISARAVSVVDNVKISSHLVWSPCKIWLLFLQSWRSQNFGDAGSPPLWLESWSTPKRHTSPLYVTAPNLVALHQIVWVYAETQGVPKLRDAGAPPPWDGRRGRLPVTY